VTARRNRPLAAWFTDMLLFLSSYTPAFGALALRFDSPTWLRVACAALTAAGATASIWFLAVMRLFTKDSVAIETIEDRGADVAGYLATYLLPVVVLSTPTTLDVIAYAMIFAVIGIIFVRSRLVYVNPTFYVFWFRLFYVTTDHGFEGYLLTRSEPVPGDRLRVVQRNKLLLAVGTSNGE
jgi:hypothetical protein